MEAEMAKLIAVNIVPFLNKAGAALRGAGGRFVGSIRAGGE
jgi:hypothetical protein